MNFKLLFIFSFAIQPFLVIAMDRPEFTDQLAFTTKEGREIRCQVLSALTDAVVGFDTDPALMSEATVDPRLLAASPKSFVKLARARFQGYVDEELEQHGVTPVMVNFRMGEAKKILDAGIKKACYGKPSARLEQEINEVAEELGLQKPVLKKYKNGDAMSARANVVAYDPVPLRDFVPTPKRRKAGWAHELFHNAHNDTQKRVARCLAFEALNKVEEFKSLDENMTRVNETFADAGPASHSREYAVNMERLWKRLERKGNNPVASSHPADAHRRKIASRMVRFHDIYATEQKLKESAQYQASSSVAEKENNARPVNRSLLKEFEKAQEDA